MHLKSSSKLLVQELQQRIRRVIDKWGPNENEESERDYKDDLARIRKDTVDFHENANANTLE